MTISREEVEHCARLARLDLTPGEVERFRAQLSAVLERAQRIQALELDDVPPTAHPVELRNVLRDDEVVPFEATQRILENAPERDGAFFKVPRILEDPS
jgi:aspartyl-tRNA(Asn)/glutamyl-tRNA(Gln) amidotransferase subunit C